MTPKGENIPLLEIASIKKVGCAVSYYQGSNLSYTQIFTDTGATGPVNFILCESGGKPRGPWHSSQIISGGGFGPVKAGKGARLEGKD